MFLLQNLDSGAGGVNQFKVNYNGHQVQMYNSQTAQQKGQFDHFQREFLDSTQRKSYGLYIFLDEQSLSITLPLKAETWWYCIIDHFKWQTEMFLEFKQELGFFVLCFRNC